MLFLAFLPPEATYSLIATDNSTAANGNSDQPTPTKKSPAESSINTRYTIHFSEKAEWQHSPTEITKIEPYFVTTSRRNQIACVYVKCTANPKYNILFSHGNAVDLGKRKQPNCSDFMLTLPCFL